MSKSNIRKSTIIKKSCLRCKSQDLETYQAIFDEDGIELNLSALLEKCFGIIVIKDETKFQALCSSCLDALIEVYDVIEMNLMNDSSNSISETSADIAEASEKNVTFEKQIDEDPILIDDSEVEETDCVSILSKDDDFLGFNNDCLDEIDDIEMENEQYIDELDDTNLLEYKTKLFGSDLKQLNVPVSFECRICSAALDNHKTVYSHTIENHYESKYICILNEKCKPMDSSAELSYHLILTHYDLDSFDLFCSCPVCGNSYKNFNIYNRHSCYKTKHLSRISLECTHCLKTFSSNKRFRFHHQFHMKSHRPKACLICDEHFRDEDDFYEHIMYTHAKNLKLICTMCDKNFTSKVFLENHLSLHQAVRKYKCEYCAKNYMYSHMLKNHVKENHINRKRFECDICHKKFIKLAAMKDHKKQNHTISCEMELNHCGHCGLIEINMKKLNAHLKTHKPQDQIITKKKLSLAMACEHCEAAYATIEQLKDHRKSHKPDEFLCNHCTVVHNEFKKLRTHKMTHKINGLKDDFPITRHYVCNAEGCNVTHILWTGLRNHKTTKHPTSSDTFPCPVCNEKFFRMPDLNTHLKTLHEGLKFVSCTVCDKVFNNRTAMSVHLSKIHNTAKLKCDECDASYFNEESLENHKDFQHRYKQCLECKKMIRTKNFALHLDLVHKNIKRHFCNICDKGYYQKNDLIEHQKAIHEKQKRFQCKICDYQTYWLNSIKIHELKHEEKRPFACNYCRSTFDNKSGLQRHTKKHSKETNFMCPFCVGVFFTSRLFLSGHLQDSHSDEPDLENNLNDLLNKRRKYSKLSTNKRLRLENKSQTNIFIDDDDGLEHEELVIKEIGNSYKIQDETTTNQNTLETTELLVGDEIIIEECLDM